MATAKVIIAGQNNIGSAVKSAQSDLAGFSQVAQKAGDTLKKAFAITAIIATVKKLGDATKSCLSDFLQAERAYKQLQIALKDNSAYKSVSANIAKLSKLTLSSKDEIESMVSELAGLGKSADEINAISEAAVNLSNVTGQSLNSSMTTLLNTYNGNTKALNKLGIETSEFTKTELASGAAVELVNQKFGELSRSMAEADTSQHIKNIKDTFGDIKQAIGEVVNFNIAPIVANIDSEFSGMFETIVGYVDYIGATFMNFPTVLNLVSSTLTKMLERLFSWDVLKSAITKIVSFIGKVFINMTDMIANLVDNLITAIIAEIQYLAASLYSELVNAILKAIGTSEEEFAKSTLGKVLNFGNKFKGVAQIGLALATNSPSAYAKGELSGMSQGLVKSAANNLVGGADPTKAAQILKDTADKAFENVGTSLLASFKTLFSYGEDAIDGISSFASDNFDDIFSDFKGSLDEIVGPTLKLLEDARNKGGSDGGGNQGQPPVETTEANFIQKVLNAFISKMGEAGEVISHLSSNMASLGPALGAILTAVEYTFEGLSETLGPILNDFIKFGIEPLKELGRIIGDLLIPLIENIMPLVKMTADFLISILNSLAIVLKPVIDIIGTVLTPVISVICAILEALMPVIKVFAKVVVTITGTIQYVIQVLQHWVASIMNWLADLSIFGWHPFGGLRMNDPGSPGSYSSYIKNKWSEVDAAFEATPSSSTSTQSSVASASYQGATHVTINIYQEAPIVGDGGMRQFAKMIRSEFENMSYYGVTA